MLGRLLLVPLPLPFLSFPLPEEGAAAATGLAVCGLRVTVLVAGAFGLCAKEVTGAAVLDRPSNKSLLFCLACLSM